MKIDPVSLVPALMTGFLLGAMFFGGLWWTIQRGLSSERSAFWFLGSLVLRTSMTLAGFYLVGRGHWERMLVCLLGFILARLIVTQLAHAAEKPASVAQDAGDAPQSR